MCEPNCERLISRRATRVVQSTDFLIEWNMRASQDKYHPKLNPDGKVNFGIAENHLCEEDMCKKVTQILPRKSDVKHHHYFLNHGSESLRSAIKKFLTDYFRPASKIHKDNLIVVSGTTAILEILSVAIADPGDYFLCPAPYYSRIRNDVFDKGGAMCYDIPMYEIDHGKSVMKLDRLRTYYEKAKQQGLRVKGLILINPNNPTGYVCSPQELKAIFKFCKRERLHVIADEIYALSSLDKNSKFSSVLSIEDMPDPQMVHFIWGLSKDLGFAGLRCGVLHSRNPDILTYARKVAFFHALPAYMQDLAQNIISDRVWLQTQYFPNYLQRLRESHSFIKKTLEQTGITVFDGRGGIFVWANFCKHMSGLTFDEEEKLFKRLFNAGVLCTPGKQFYSVEPGWFRIAFAVNEEHLLEGLMRISRVLQNNTCVLPKQIHRNLVFSCM